MDLRICVFAYRYLRICKKKFTPQKWVDIIKSSGNVENWAESGVFILDQVRNVRLLQKPTEPLSLLLSQPAMLSTLHA